jgi:hypothetical protein
VQSSHAALCFTAEYPDIPVHDLPLVLLAVPDEPRLYALASDAMLAGLRIAPFYEPDLGNELTAIALEPAAARLCRKLPLALRGIHHAQEQDEAAVAR